MIFFRTVKRAISLIKYISAKEKLLFFWYNRFGDTPPFLGDSSGVGGGMSPII
jgi:hypothetical protein